VTGSLPGAPLGNLLGYDCPTPHINEPARFVDVAGLPAKYNKGTGPPRMDHSRQGETMGSRGSQGPINIRIQRGGRAIPLAERCRLGCAGRTIRPWRAYVTRRLAPLEKWTCGPPGRMLPLLYPTTTDSRNL